MDSKESIIFDAIALLETIQENLFNLPGAIFYESNNAWEYANFHQEVIKSGQKQIDALKRRAAALGIETEEL